MTRPTYGSLFSGVGGMDMGFDTHMDCVFQVEWDKHAQSILRRHWPNVPKWGDVQEVNGADLPPCDVLTFGSPCQDLSVAGKRAGLDGGRSSMFYEAVRIIKEMRDATSSQPTGPLPRIAVWENVPGALSSNGGKDFGVVLDELAHLGAVAIEWRVLDAQHFGVPQRRRRVFLVAIFDPATADRCPDPLLPVSEGRRGDFAKGRKKGQDVAGSVATRVDTGSTHRQLGHGHYVEDDTASALKQRDYKDATDLAVIPIIFDGTRHDDFRMDTDVVPTLKQRMGTGGGQVPMLAEPVAIVTHDVVGTLQSRSHKGVNHEGARDGQLVIEAEPVAASFKPGASAKAYGIGYEEEIAPTLESGGGGNNKPAIIQPVAEPIVYDGYNQALDDSGIHRSLRVGRDSSDFVAQPVTVFQPGAMIRLGGGVSDDIVPTLRAEAKRGDNEPHIATSLAVRRLTPLECERLMGWPDHHTRYTDLGTEQADTHRYKQCGNGVAAPVARWIAGHLTRILG